MDIPNIGSTNSNNQQVWGIEPNVWWGEQVSMDEVDEADEADEAEDIDDGWVKPTIILNILEAR